MNEFSIIIPIYNSDKHIEKCIRSVLNQTYRDFELLLINDGSTDNSKNICEKFAEMDNRITLYNKNNGGVSSARNFGISKSSGEYIVFVDSDDYIEKELLEELYNASIKHNCNAYIHSININNIINQKNLDIKFDKNYIIVDQRSISKIMPILIENRYINQPWNKMYLSKKIKDEGILFNENIIIGEDVLFNFQYFSNIDNMILIKKKLYNYYDDNPNSLTHVYNKNKYSMIIFVNDELQNLIERSENFKYCKKAADINRIKAIYSSLFDAIENRINCIEKDNLMENIFNTNHKFRLRSINKISYKMLAFAVNTKNKKILDVLSSVAYYINKKYRYK